MKNSFVCLIAFLFISLVSSAQNLKTADVNEIGLYPQQNEIRNTINLSGIWQFKKDSVEAGESAHWYTGLQGSVPIAVPGSWNEQIDGMRDYMGPVWYEQSSYIPKSWDGQKIYMRVGSATYGAKVWMNGKPVGQHEGGHLPFAFEVTGLVNWNKPNRITIRVENILKPGRVPVGGLPSGGMFNNNPKSNFDFFPFGGLDRPVWLYTVPSSSIADITVKTTIQHEEGLVEVKVRKQGLVKTGKVVLEGEGHTFEARLTFDGENAIASIKVFRAHLWSVEDPFLYQLKVSLEEGAVTTDTYELAVGVRTIAVDNKHILLNGKPVFLKGFGKHEDFPVFGKGTAYPVLIKDFNLLKWVGANSFRTSHYPYDEEYMAQADKQGFLIIDEIPAVGLYFDNDLALINERKETCKQQIKELIARDKNHPSVIMWNLANEPIAKGMDFKTGKKVGADSVSLSFFAELFKTAKEADNTRLTSIVGLGGGPDEWLALSDVICINRYYGWYSQSGDLVAAAKLLSNELDANHRKYNKPIIVTEFGADAYPGRHSMETEMFTEEYQMNFIKAYLDVASTKDFVTGMHVWAFADFKTAQAINRFGAMNWKGVFTQDRKPKMAAYYLKSVWGKR